MTYSPLVTVLGMTFNIYGVILLVLGIIFLFALWNAHKKKGLDWTDMITRDGTKVSTTKILQLVGGVVGTWIIIQVTLSGLLTWDLFAIYLAYVASIDGFSKLIMARYGAERSDDSRVPFPRRDPYPQYRPTAPYPATRRNQPIDGEVDTRPAAAQKTPDIDD